MLFSPVDPLWVGLIVLVLLVLIYGLCYCLKLCVEAVKTGQKILTEQQESMSEEEKGLKRKRKKKGDTVLSGGQKGQNKRVEAEEEGELAFAPPPYASSSAIYGQTFCPEVWKEDRFSLLGCPIFTDQAEFAWDRDMLLDQGRFAQQQSGYPVQVFKQVNQIAIRAQKSLPNRGEANENLTLILTPQMDTQVIEVMVSSPRGIVSIPPGDRVDQVLMWARGSVCVFPQDQTEPLWVPERLMRRCKNEAPDPVAPVDVVDDPTSTKDGAEMRDPFVPDFKNYLIGGFIILTATIVCCVCIYKVFKVDIVLWYRDSCSGFLPSKASDGKTYDAYILYPKTLGEGSFSDLDTFVFKLLPEVLEGQFGYKLFIYGRDDYVGEDTIEVTNENVKKSRRLIIILVRDMGGFSWLGQSSEEQIAIYNALIQEGIKIVLLELEKIQDYEKMPDSIQFIKQKHGVICWSGDFQERPQSAKTRFWKNLRYQMPAQRRSPLSKHRLLTLDPVRDTKEKLPAATHLPLG